MWSDRVHDIGKNVVASIAVATCLGSVSVVSYPMYAYAVDNASESVKTTGENANQTGTDVNDTATTTGSETSGTASSEASSASTQSFKPVEEKSSTPIPIKYIYENSTGEWQKGADVTVGNVAKYRILGTMSHDLDEYTSYEWYLHDKPDENTPIKIDSLSVSLMHIDGKSEDIKNKLEISYENGELVIGAKDIIKALPGLRYNDVIVIEYDCDTVSGFGIGMAESNDNYCYIHHTNEDGQGTTDSVEVSASALSWALAIRKVSAEDSKPLAGATFELAGANNEKLVEFTTTSDGLVTLKGIDSGVYTLTETKAPEGYEKVAPIKITLIPTWDGKVVKTMDVKAEGAKVDASDISTGTFTVSVEDKATKEPSKPTNPTNPSTPKANPVGSVAGGAIPKLGDMAVAGGTLLVLVGAGVLLIGFGLSKRRASNLDE